MQAHRPKVGRAEHNAAQAFAQHQPPKSVEKRCGKCGEYWPADTEFFYRRGAARDGLSSNCKACYAELPSVQARNRCNNPRLSSTWEQLFGSGEGEVPNAN